MGRRGAREGRESVLQTLEKSKPIGQIKTVSGVKPNWKPIKNSPQELALNCQADELFFGGGAGGGKAGRCPDRSLPNYSESIETKVLTPKGFKLFGDIRVDDQVCNPDGTVARVIQIQDHGSQQFYRVTLADGSSVEASEGHLWGVSISGKRKRAKHSAPIVPDGLTSEDEWNLRYFQRFRVMDTLDLKRRVDRAKGQLEVGERLDWPLLPLSGPVLMTYPKGRGERLPAYTLGVLIGDGCISESVGIISFTKPDFEIYEHVKADLDGVAYVDRNESEGRCPYHVIHSGVKGQRAAPIIEMLRRDGLYGCVSNNKFIPARIKSGPIEERFAFIQGLFDTDGHMDDRGHVEYTTVSKQLAEDTQYVLRSLGYKATMSAKIPTYTSNGERLEGQLDYRIYVQGLAKDRLFRLSRKKAHVSLFNGGDVAPSNRVVSVEKTAIDNARCITVSHPNCLYITDDFIVTHNSHLLLGLGSLYHEKAIIFRREFPQLKELISESRKILQACGSYNSQEHIWKHSGGRTLEFGAVQYEHDVERYQGRAHDGKFFDEIVHFSQLQYETLKGWARSANAAQRVRVVATGNPPANYQGQWVKEYWGAWLDVKHENPATPGELVWYVRMHDRDIEVGRGPKRPDPVMYKGELVFPISRTFIPAKVDDNPYYLASGYKKTLQAMPEPLRSQLLYGDFASGVPDDLMQLFPTEWIDAAIKRWTKNPPEGHSQSTLGVDPARGGKDNSVIAERRENWFNVHKYPGSETKSGDALAALVVKHRYGSPTIYIDVIGVGSSPYDSLEALGLDPIALVSNEGSVATDRSGRLKMGNKRAEWAWKLREALDPDYDSQIALPDSNTLKADLTAIRWKTKGDSIWVEPKDDIRKRLGRSPDEGEAIIYASIGADVEFWFGFGSEGDDDADDNWAETYF